MNIIEGVGNECIDYVDHYYKRRYQGGLTSMTEPMSSGAGSWTEPNLTAWMMDTRLLSSMDARKRISSLASVNSYSLEHGVK